MKLWNSYRVLLYFKYTFFESCTYCKVAVTKHSHFDYVRNQQIRVIKSEAFFLMQASTVINFVRSCWIQNMPLRIFTRYFYNVIVFQTPVVSPVSSPVMANVTQTARFVMARPNVQTYRTKITTAVRRDFYRRYLYDIWIGISLRRDKWQEYMYFCKRFID